MENRNNQTMTKKEVNVKGVPVECVQDQEGKIWVILPSLCNGLGIRTEKQVDRIKRDEDLLLQGYAKMGVPSNGGVQEMGVIELTYLPYFLTGIKSSMCREEIRENIVEFKLKAKDILAEAFLGKNNEKAESFFDSIGLEMRMKEIVECAIKEANKPLQDKIINLEDMFNKKFKIYTNESSMFSNLLTQFCAKAYGIGTDGTKPYSLFYKDIQDWFGITLPNNIQLKEKNYKNTKDYIIKVIGIEALEFFVNGILSDRIVKSDEGHWFDLSGVYQNDIEFAKVMHNWTDDKGNCHCAYCGTVITSETANVEHIIHQSDINSSDCAFNILPACQPCNFSKYDQAYEEWYPKQEFCKDFRQERIANHIKKYSYSKTI